MDESGCVPTKLYLQQQVTDQRGSHTEPVCWTPSYSNMSCCNKQAHPSWQLLGSLVLFLLRIQGSPVFRVIRRVSSKENLTLGIRPPSCSTLPDLFPKGHLHPICRDESLHPTSRQTSLKTDTHFPATSPHSRGENTNFGEYLVILFPKSKTGWWLEKDKMLRKRLYCIR